MQLSNTNEKVLLNNFVQELFGNRIETLRAVIMLLLREVESLEKTVTVSDRSVQNTDQPLSEKLEQFEKDTIRCALIQTNGRQKSAAEMLGMKLTTLNAKIKKYEINWRLPQSNPDFVAVMESEMTS